MYETTDIRKGLKFQIDGEPYTVVDFQFVKPGKGNAFTRTRIKNLATGAVMDRTYRSGEKLEEARMDERETAYPGLAYQHVPRQRVEPTVDFLVEERAVEQGLSDDALRSIVDNVMKSSIGRHITAEINLARFIRGMTLDARKQAIKLLKRLEAYQGVL